MVLVKVGRWRKIITEGVANGRQLQHSASLNTLTA